MSWSWKLGRIAGIPLYVHWTFLILLGYVGYSHWKLSGGDPSATAAGVATILAIFGCVVLHELGHALMARRFGVPTADITLLPIGGVARLQRIPEHPGQELLIALAGPAVNVVIAAILGGGLIASGRSLNLSGFLRGELPFAQELLLVNLFLALFNLIPAFPMDGGRVLRALLALAMPYPRATRIAASVGQFIAIGFGFLGLTGGNPMFLLIALFVWLGAEAEARQVEERASLGDARVRDAILTDYKTLRSSSTLGDAADLLLAGSQHDFPVLDADDEPVGLLTRDRLMAGLSKDGRDGPVTDYAGPAPGTVSLGEPLVPALARLRQGEGPCLLVMDGDHAAGLLTLENIGELLMVRTALSAGLSKADVPSRAPRRPPGIGP